MQYSYALTNNNIHNRSTDGAGLAPPVAKDGQSLLLTGDAGIGAKTQEIFISSLSTRNSLVPSPI